MKLDGRFIHVPEWYTISLGRGFFEFKFKSQEDLRMTLVAGPWIVNSGILRLSL